MLIVAVQGVYGVIAQSTALIADAGHNLSDVLGLLLAWGAIWLGKRAPSANYTFGLRGSSIVASLANAAFLFVACGAIAWEAALRFMHPAPVQGMTVFVVACAGLLVNGFSAWLFMAGGKHDINVRGAFLHMLGDAGVSAAVAVSGLVILYTGWQWVDPLLSLLVVAVVIWGTFGLCRQAIRLALSGVPAAVDTARVAGYLAQLPGVEEVHDLHIWGLSTTENSLTVHLVMPGGHPGDAFIDDVVRTLARDHALHHATIQIDLGADNGHRCVFESGASSEPG